MQLMFNSIKIDIMKLTYIFKTQLKNTFFPQNIASNPMTIKGAWAYFYILVALMMPIYILITFVTGSVAQYPVISFIFGHLLNYNLPFFAYEILSPIIFVAGVFAIRIIIISLVFHGLGKFVFKTFLGGYNATLTAAVYAYSVGTLLWWVAVPLLMLSSSVVYSVIVTSAIGIPGLGMIVFFFALASLHNTSRRRAFIVSSIITIIIVLLILLYISLINCNLHPYLCYIPASIVY